MQEKVHSFRCMSNSQWKTEEGTEESCTLSSVEPRDELRDRSQQNILRLCLSGLRDPGCALLRSILLLDLELRFEVLDAVMTDGMQFYIHHSI